MANKVVLVETGSQIKKSRKKIQKVVNKGFGKLCNVIRAEISREISKACTAG